MDHINTIDPTGNIKFTYEEEENFGSGMCMMFWNWNATECEMPCRFFPTAALSTVAV